MAPDDKEQYSECLSKVVYFSDQLYSKTSKETLEEVSSFLLALELDNSKRDVNLKPIVALLRESRITHLREILSKLDHIIHPVELIEDD